MVVTPHTCPVQAVVVVLWMFSNDAAPRTRLVVGSMKTMAEKPVVAGVGTVIVVEEDAVMLLLTTSASASV